MAASAPRRASPIVAAVGADEMRQRIRARSRLKGRQVDDISLAEVRSLLGAAPAGGWRRDPDRVGAAD